MAYVKTNWVNNTTPIDENNLNKIEKGIYDNSLITEAIADKLNPTDTETYKTAELTEGQITDVIGVNDIIIKGQTEQDGTPTPSAPVDVNVVSGSNVVNTSNKNLFNKDTVVNQSNYNGSVGQVISIGTNANTFRCPIFRKTSDKITISANDTSATMRVLLLDKDYKILSTTGYTTLPRTIDTSNCEFIAIFFDGTTITINNNIQIEQNSTATTYEPHQGKELPLDLPVENLCKPITTATKSGITMTNNGDGSYTLNGTATANTSFYNATLGLEIDTYTFSANNPVVSSNSAFYFQVEYQGGGATVQTFNDVNAKKTFTTTRKIITWAIVVPNGITLNNFVIKPQLEKGSKANSYTPYGTTPIELCKIGDYQDYFYKSGSKWYLHKEINKDAIDENNNIVIANTNTSNWYYRISPKQVVSTASQTNQFCNYYPNSEIFNGNTNQGILKISGGEEIRIRYGTEDTVANFKTWLASNNIALYSILATATDTEITDTTLISQLEAIYNAPLYEQTNITQTNNDLPMVLDITACKDNINGIKAFIRK